ncbi:acetyl-CoA synthetase-like protein [Ceratobasidium sp. AG-I]|nr:acetyl-CoA synthetase-like protein [Ceratobasidium sp. AG-I]
MSRQSLSVAPLLPSLLSTMVFEAPAFVRPPTDGSITLERIIDFHLDNNPSHPFAVLYDVHSRSQSTITYKQLAHAVHRAAHIINPGASIPQGTNIAIFISTDTIMYIALVLGAMRAGLVPFPISPRAQVQAVAHLCTKSGTSHVLAGGSPAINQLGDSLRDSLPHLEFTRLPSLEKLFPGHTNLANDLDLFPELSPTRPDSVLAILHSSGSTALPRPIPQHQRGLFKNIVNQPITWMYSESGTRVGTMALPTFHVIGLANQCINPLFVGYTQTLFAPSSSGVPAVPTPTTTLQAMSDTQCGYLFAAPAFLEVWSRDEKALSELRKLKCVTFGGASLSTHIGSTLVNNGVPLHCGYGSTELGGITAPYHSTSSSPYPLKQNLDPLDWAYIRFSDQVEIKFEPVNDSEDTRELVFISTSTHEPFELNTEIGGRSAYRTKDLVVRHPSNLDLWRVVGRLDDQIVLLNGEKTNPVPMEAEIVQSPIVQGAVMFGRERNQTGVLIELVNDLKINHTEIVEEIWPYIERANQTSPTHSRLTRDTIIFTRPAEPLPRTPKGAIARAPGLKAYEKEIEEMYNALEKGVVVGSGAEVVWEDVMQVRRWVKERVEGVLRKEVDAEGDLFQQGMDSLSVTMLSRILRGAHDQMDQQTIFDNPTIQQLAGALIRLHSGEQASVPAVHDQVRSMIQKYDSYSTREPILLEARSNVKERVLVTGTTGGLGSHLLFALLQSEKVEKIWALNRGSKEEVIARQKLSFQDKLLDVGLLESKRLSILEADLEDKFLGLDGPVYQEINQSVTAIIHCSWQVNFNLSLQSFEPSILGARNLLDLAFDALTPPRFLFTSSVAAAGPAYSGKLLQEEYLGLDDCAGSIGYGQSKLLTEKLLESARSAGLETCIVRLGQLTGDERSGAWSPTDWVPSMIASSVSVGCLPATTGSVSWLPLDVAAQSIIDACIARSALLPPVIHCSHPRPVEWSHIINLFAGALESRTEGKQVFSIVSFREWSERVRSAASAFRGSDTDRNRRFPSTKIQTTFDSIERAGNEVRGEDKEVEAGGTARLSSIRAEELSRNLRDVPRIGKEHVERWVGYWENTGLFV